MEPGKFAVIGCRHAHIGSFIREMTGLGYTCAGIYERGNPALAKAFSEQFGIPFANDLESLLAAPDVGIVGCAAVNHEKIQIIETCEKYGKHIMLDKPIVTGREGLDRLEAVFARGTIQVGMLLTSRDRPSIYTLKRQMDNGELGRLVSITMRKPHKLTPEIRESWHFSKEQNGGIIIDLLIHDFDLLRWLTGKEVLRIGSFMAKNILPQYPEFYDTAAVQAVLEGNVIAQLYADWHTPETCWAFGDCRIFVTGTKGCAELRMFGDPAVSMDELMFKMTHGEKFQRVELMAPPVSVVEDFLHRIAGEPCQITHRDLFLASKATVEADEQAVLFKSC